MAGQCDAREYGERTGDFHGVQPFVEQFPGKQRRQYRLQQQRDGGEARRQVCQGVGDQALPANVRDQRQHQQHQPAVQGLRQHGLAGE